MSQNNHNSNGNSNSIGHKSNGNGRKPHRTYSDKQIADALTVLKSCNGNMLQASKESGIPRKTLESWAKEKTQRVVERGEELAEVRQISESVMISRLESLIVQILDAAPGKLAEAPFGQTMTGFGIATDKWRLLQDKPTSIQSAGDDEFGQMVKEYAKRFHLPLSVARENIKRNLTNPTAIAALDAIELASEEKQ